MEFLFKFLISYAMIIYFDVFQGIARFNCLWPGLIFSFLVIIAEIKAWKLEFASTKQFHRRQRLSWKKKCKSISCIKSVLNLIRHGLPVHNFKWIPTWFANADTDMLLQTLEKMIYNEKYSHIFLSKLTKYKEKSVEAYLFHYNRNMFCIYEFQLNMFFSL